MTSQAHTSHQGHGGQSHERHYVMIWLQLVVLLLVSVFGPMVATHYGWHWLLLATAFGVAVVKAYMVAKNFMHLNVEKPIIHYIMAVGVALMVLMYGALAPDVQKGEGQHWKKSAGFHHSYTTSKPTHEGHAEGAVEGATEGAVEKTEHEQH
jgi:caa(3)-type oxidase subunit IV